MPKPPKLVLSDLVDDELLTVLSETMPVSDLQLAVEECTAKSTNDIFKIVTDEAITKAGGRAAIFTMTRALKVLFYEAHAMNSAVVTPEVRAAAEQRLQGRLEPMQELYEYVLQDRLTLMTIHDRYAEGNEAPLIRAAHPIFQTYYVASAICDLPDVRLPVLPWHFDARWADVLKLGGSMGDVFWRGLLRAIPDKAPEAALLKAVQIRDVVGGDRSVSLVPVGAFLRMNPNVGITKLDWSELLLDDAQAIGLFQHFEKDTLMQLTRLYLNDNAIGALGWKSFAGSLARGSLPALEEMRLSNNTGFGDAGMKSLSDALAAGAMKQLKQLYLNNCSIGDEGIVRFSAVLQPEFGIGELARSSTVKALYSDGILANLELLTLAYNDIGERGVRALAAICAAGALERLSRFMMTHNQPSGAPSIVTNAIMNNRKPRPRKFLPLYRWPDEIVPEKSKPES